MNKQDAVFQTIEAHPLFKAPTERITFAKFLYELHMPIYDDDGNSNYYIEICSLREALSKDGKKIKYLVTHSFQDSVKNYEIITNRVKADNFDSCVFLTVCPRDTQYMDEETGRAIRTTQSDVSIATSCWADIDFKRLSPDPIEAEKIAIQSIMMLDPFPNIIVKTPGGFHIYYLLADTYPVEDVVYTNQRLKEKVKADACGDAVRIMRVPMGKHYKDPNNPLKVSIIHFDDTRRYTLDDFDHFPDVHYTEAVWETKVQIPSTVADIDLEVLQTRFLDKKLASKIMAKSLEEYRELFEPKSTCPSRSERDFHIICQLYKSNIAVEEIYAIFMTTNCGDKYLEKGRYGDAYLRRQIEAAIYRVEEDNRINGPLAKGLKPKLQPQIQS